MHERTATSAFFTRARLAADGLGLAAAPTLALMALISGMSGGDAVERLCMAAHGTSPLNGMALMYGLMSVFHLRPWLKRIGGRRRRIGLF